MNTLTGILIFIYIIVLIIYESYSIQFDEPTYKIVLWPIVFIKYLLIGLFKILFTNWKNFVLIFVLISAISCNSNKGLHSNINHKFIKEHNKQQKQ